MIHNKMSIVVPKFKVNRWDKDSIRPGPVGSVGDVNVQVRLRNSTPALAERFDSTFSKNNASWSGSNVSDGMWYGWTSGGREATVVSKALPNIQTGGKTEIGWMVQNIVPTDRSRATKVTPLGRYGWDTTVGSVLKSKHSGELFLPAPSAYEKTALPRGSQFPRIIAETMGDGVALPAADVKLTDPVFGETGTIQIDQPNCTIEDIRKVYTPETDDPIRNTPLDMFNRKYPWRDISPPYNRYPPVGDNIKVAKFVWKSPPDSTKPERPRIIFETISTAPCGSINRTPEAKLPTRKETVPMPGNQDKRREDRKKEQEKDKNKKQKMR